MGERSDLRVPMRPRLPLIGPDDIAASLQGTPGPRYGRRFSIDIAEDAFAAHTAEIIEMAAERLAHQVVAGYARLIEDTIRGYLYNKEWARPILEKEMRRVTTEYLRAMFSDFEEQVKGSPHAD